MTRMERIGVYLRPSQIKRLREKAKASRRPMSSILRDALDIGLDELDERARIWREMNVPEAAE